MKKCTACLEEKELSEFYKDPRAKSGLQARCRTCYKQYKKDRYKNDPKARQRALNWQRQQREQNPRRRRDYLLRYAYGITIEQQDALLAQQGGRCAICPRTEPGGSRQWHIDHDHQSGNIRGILCHYCNTALGLFGESALTLTSAINYLGREPAIVIDQAARRRYRKVT